MSSLHKLRGLNEKLYLKKPLPLLDVLMMDESTESTTMQTNPSKRKPVAMLARSRNLSDFDLNSSRPSTSRAARRNIKSFISFLVSTLKAKPAPRPDARRKQIICKPTQKSNSHIKFYVVKNFRASVRK